MLVRCTQDVKFKFFNILVIIAFRGTEMTSIQQWLSNLKVSLIPFRNVQVHQGFYESWLSVKDRVVGLLRTLPTHKQMLFMGIRYFSLIF